MHKSRKRKVIKGTGTSGKTIVFGVLDRKKRKVRAKVVNNTDRGTLTREVSNVVEKGSVVYTDGHSGYDQLTEQEFIHKVIDRAIHYVNGTVHTNGIENFWSLLKRCIKGTYIGVEPFHLFRYIDEQTFHYDYKDKTNLERLCRVETAVKGRRLTYKQLIGQAS